jgi:hypothetical protein
MNTRSLLVTSLRWRLASLRNSLVLQVLQAGFQPGGFRQT